DSKHSEQLGRTFHAQILMLSNDLNGSSEVGGLFLPWSAANAAAIGRGDKSFTMSLGGAEWTQEPQKYHARSLAEIRAKFAIAKDAPGLEEILREGGCLDFLS
ncbi:MAG: hypothetical protein Q8M69_02075, partial [Reyranella sp.]|nr:hypothetical protein [Reyranella sp.]